MSYGLGENTLFDLSRSHKMCPVPSTDVTYSGTKFEVATSNGLGGDAYTIIVAQYPLHHVTYSGSTFEVATPHGLGDVFTRKYII